MFIGIQQIYIFSEAVEESACWYERLLGVQRDESESIREQFALIRVGGVDLCFHPADAKSPVSTGGCVAYWKVDNLDDAISKASEAGGVLYRGPIQIHESSRWMAQIRDLMGNVFGIEGKAKQVNDLLLV